MWHHHAVTQWILQVRSTYHHSDESKVLKTSIPNLVSGLYLYIYPNDSDVSSKCSIYFV